MKVDMPELDVLDKLDLILKYSKDDKKLLWARNKRALLFLKMERELLEDDDEV